MRIQNTKEELEAMNKAELVPIPYGGRTYTKYEATQRQRQLETIMRAKRQEIHLLETGGAAESDIINARGKYRAVSAEYVRFSKAMDLPQQRERVTVDGLGNIGQGKYKNPLTEWQSSAIIGETKDASGARVYIVKKVVVQNGPKKGITEYHNKKGGIDRNYYDKDGNQCLQISNHNHGNPKKHPFGKNGEHAHDYWLDENGKPQHGEAREMTDREKKKNGDII